MKTTLEIPDALFRQAKSTAAAQGRSLKDFVTEAIEDKLARKPERRGVAEPPWMESFGRLRRLRKETARIQAEIDRQFGVVEPEDRD